MCVHALRNHHITILLVALAPHIQHRQHNHEFWLKLSTDPHGNLSGCLQCLIIVTQCSDLVIFRALYCTILLSILICLLHVLSLDKMKPLIFPLKCTEFVFIICWTFTHILPLLHRVRCLVKNTQDHPLVYSHLLLLQQRHKPNTAFNVGLKCKVYN